MSQKVKRPDDKVKIINVSKEPFQGQYNLCPIPDQPLAPGKSAIVERYIATHLKSQALIVVVGSPSTYALKIEELSDDDLGALPKPNEVAEIRDENSALKAENRRLESEVSTLKQGLELLEKESKKLLEERDKKIHALENQTPEPQPQKKPGRPTKK